MSIESLPRRITSLLRHLLQRQEIDADLDAEIRSQLELLTDQKIKEGLPQDEARRAAKIELGGVEQLKEQVRAVRTSAWLDSLLQDIRFAVRMLRKNPGFSAVAVFTLALGIGANTAIFSAVDGILLEPLPYLDPPQLVELSSSVRMGKALFFGGLSPQYLDAIRTGCPAFTDAAGYSLTFFTMIAHSIPERISGAKVSPELFSVLGVWPLLGRPILPTDSAGGNVAVLSYEIWKNSFGTDPSIVGHTVLLDSKAYTIVGVMPPQFQFPPDKRGIWIPLAANEGMSAAIARLAPGATRSQAAAQLGSLVPRLRPDAKNWSITARDLDEEINRLRVELPILLGAVAFILIIACVNLSTLLLSRGSVRTNEIAVRGALGATRSRLCRQFLTESLLIALLGGVAALLFVPWLIGVVRRIAPPNTHGIENVRLDTHVLLFASTISLLSAIAFGIAPALRLSRSGDLTKLRQGLTSTRTGLANRGTRRIQHALVGLELALAVVLSVGSALLVRSFNILLNVKRGFRTDHIISMQVSFTSATCPNPMICGRTEEDILERLHGVSKVSAVAFTSALPLYSGTNVSETLQIEGQPEEHVLAEGIHIVQRSVSADYFRTLGIPLLAGRTFDRDESSSSDRILINEAFARRYFKSSPLGERVSFRNDHGYPVWSEIIGVVGDTRDNSLDQPAAIAFYRPFAQVMYANNPETLIVRSTINPIALLSTIRQEVWSVDKNAPITHVSTMDQVVADSVAEPRFRVALLSTFSVLGLLLAMIGTYGVVSYAVAQRTHEIGVRVALGASQEDVLRLVLKQGMLPSLVGISAGIVGALALTRLLKSFLFGLAPTDPAAFVAVAIFVTLTAFCACYIPARRAMRVDPMTALRHE